MEKNQTKGILNWYVLTGGPSSGKTAVLEELSKLGYTIFPETARVFIDKEIAKGRFLKEIRRDEAEFQKKVFELKIEIEKNAPQDKIVFFDRALPDTLAYYQICGLDPQEVIGLCQGKRYRKVFFLEQLPLEKDYARTEDDETVKKLNKLLRESYENLGYEVVNIPVISVKERVQKILSEINKT